MLRPGVPTRGSGTRRWLPPAGASGQPNATATPETGEEERTTYPSAPGPVPNDRGLSPNGYGIGACSYIPAGTGYSLSRRALLPKISVLMIGSLHSPMVPKVREA